MIQIGVRSTSWRSRARRNRSLRNGPDIVGNSARKDPGNAFLNSFGRGPRVLSVPYGPADDNVISAVSERLFHCGNPLLIIRGPLACRPELEQTLRKVDRKLLAFATKSARTELGGLAKDESWSHTFTEPGVYSYSIKQHPSAKATITVE